MRLIELLTCVLWGKLKPRVCWAVSLSLLLSGCATVVPPSTEISEQFYSLLSDSNPPQTAHGIAQRIETLSGLLLQSPYLANGLGEGENAKFDPDPLVRFDAFDCTTYVETVLAGAFSNTQPVFMYHLRQLRYRQGEVDFAARNHFPSADWIPNNQAYLTDISAQVAGDELQFAHTVIDKQAWYQHMDSRNFHCPLATQQQCDELLQALRQLGEGIAPQSVSTAYVPIKALYAGLTIEGEAQWTGLNEALLARIPSGSVISVVRPDWALKKWIGTNMNISHQGFAIRKNGRLYLRHASQENGQVMDVDFAEYFSAYLAWSSIKGFNVLQAGLTPLPVARLHAQ